MRARILACVAVLTIGLSGCGYSSLTRQDEDVKAAWSDVLNQYQRRADLIPNLVKAVQGYANQEQQVLIGVTAERAKVASSIQLTPELLNDPDAFARYQAAQAQLTSSLKSLIAVSEAYPDLKSNENFRDLQVQLEGTENRITVARQKYIEAVQSYNTTARALPNLLTAKMFDFQLKPNFTVAEPQAISKPPSVDFGPGPARPANDASTPPTGSAMPPAPAPPSPPK
ncbi:MAG: LemA family protein [Proteobacteria bacterium]|nr:LemA family protein [Pseudomonadota bacterium]